MERLQAEAVEAKRGLWVQPGAVAPWDWRKGTGVTEADGVVGNKNSRVYHAPNCPSVGRMSEKNRVKFGSAEEAAKEGYKKAGDCR